ncbi:MAG: GGDEF domain-containing protein [Erysipelotrichaceae bacterium]
MDKKIKGIRITTLNMSMIVLSLIVFVLLIGGTFSLNRKYESLINNTDDYMLCEKASSDLSNASDYLTEQVRLFTVNYDSRNMFNYFEEANSVQRREKALDSLKNNEMGTGSAESLNRALKASNDLMEREIRAMKLICVANGYENMPEEVKDYVLNIEDMNLSNNEKINKARTLVFDEGYESAKEVIRTHLGHYTDSIIDVLDQRQSLLENNMNKALSYQRILIIILFVMNVITFIAITVLIIRPLSIHIKHIKEDNLLNITGSYEFKYLALTYNDIYEINKANKLALEDKVKHDPLTGLLNRGGYDDLKNILKDSTSPLAFVIFDVDKFKDINDTYGHEKGDEVLKEVGSLLQTTFRASDYAIRLGGDEFALVMMDMRRRNIDALKEKLNYLNKTLLNYNPSVSLSIGVAFSDAGFHEELYKQADSALYDVKKNGRGSFRVFE